MCLAAAGAAGEECRLTLKRLGSRWSYSPSDYQIRATYPQQLHTQFLSPGVAGRVRVEVAGMEDQAAAFKRIVKKEPAKYQCEHPFKGVAKLGGQEFAFVFDAVGAKPDEKAKEEAEKAKAAEEKAKSKPKSSLLGALSRALSSDESSPEGLRPRGRAIIYNRLYFDLNHNGDLTDDKVIESESSGGTVYSSGDYARAQFPEITVPLEAGGTKYEYSFTMYVTYQAINDRQAYAYASLNASAYREGEITLEGKKRRVVLVDFNSNGRFDDPIKLRTGDRGRSRDDEVYPEFGDILLLDPQADLPVYLNPADATSAGNRYHVSKLVSIDGKFYHLGISPSGDKLSLNPAAPAIGYVTNPNDGFTAVVYSDEAFLKIRGDKSKPVPLPEGSWKLLSYTIDRTGMAEAEKPAAEKKAGAASKEKPGTLLEALLNAMAGSAASPATARPYRMTRVSAQAMPGYKPVTVRKGETVAMPFGPPYKPVVRVDYPSGPGQVRLGMTLFGSAGERCTDMMVQGNRPSKPAFTISNPKGEIVYRGSFDYG
jgi:hypothetical protein